jgi:hypothetical protein
MGPGAGWSKSSDASVTEAPARVTKAGFGSAKKSVRKKEVVISLLDDRAKTGLQRDRLRNRGNILLRPESLFRTG